MKAVKRDGIGILFEPGAPAGAHSVPECLGNEVFDRQGKVSFDLRLGRAQGAQHGDGSTVVFLDRFVGETSAGGAAWHGEDLVANRLGSFELLTSLRF